MEPQPPEAVAETHTKRARTDAFTCRLYERAIAFRNTLSDLEMDHAKWNKALEKLYTVMVSGPSSCPSGVKFDPLDMDRNLQQIRVLCGARSPNTISKRANSLLRFCLWHRGFSSVPIVSNFVKGILDKKALTRPRRKQARPLTVSEVIYLESVLRNSSIDLVDRFAAGAFLLALFGRCRWSDLRHVNNFFLDTNEVDGRTIGYMEFTTFSHKTAAQVARHGLPLPLVAPIWGLEKPCWALEWNKIAKKVGRIFDDTFKGPILPAPDKFGNWGSRSVTAAEASKWLLELLRPNGSNLDEVTSHSLKCTVLSWLAKAGAEPHHRLVLGHHSTQRGSLETYSRDMLSAPLRAMEDVLRKIRMGALHPGLTRSGHIQEPTKMDCARDGQKDPGEPQSSSSDSSDSSGSNSDSTESEHGLTRKWHAVGGNDPNVCKSTWGSGTMHQHVQSKIVHLQQEGSDKIFYCGLHATKDHRVIEATPFLENRKCKRCTRVLNAA